MRASSRAARVWLQEASSSLPSGQHLQGSGCAVVCASSLTDNAGQIPHDGQARSDGLRFLSTSPASCFDGYVMSMLKLDIAVCEHALHIHIHARAHVHK